MLLFDEFDWLFDEFNKLFDWLFNELQYEKVLLFELKYEKVLLLLLFVHISETDSNLYYYNEILYKNTRSYVTCFINEILPLSKSDLIYIDFYEDIVKLYLFFFIRDKDDGFILKIVYLLRQGYIILLFYNLIML